MAATFPDDSVPALCDEWWVEDTARTVGPGRLLHAFVPFPEQKPYELIPEGRPDATVHTRMLFSIRVFDMARPTAAAVSALPVAAMPLRQGEHYCVVRGKVRPVLVVGMAMPRATGEFLSGTAPWQTAPTLLVAPYYGGDQDGTPGGWNPEFVRRIRRAAYPQFWWDQLPLPGGPSESILRLDHAFSISAHQEAFAYTRHRLSEEGVEFLETWFSWLLTGELDPESLLGTFRQLSGAT